jgi:hypothetical protein
MSLTTPPPPQEVLEQQYTIGDQDPRPSSNETIVIAESKVSDSQNQEAVDGSVESIEESRDFKYPLTLSKSYPARIVFRAVKVEGVDIAEQIGDLVSFVEKTIDDLESRGRGVLGPSLNRIGGNALPLQGEEQKNRSRLQESTTASVGDEKASGIERRETAGTVSNFKTFENKGPGESFGKVTLPLQRDLRYSDLAQYETANLGTLGGGLESFIQGQGRNPFAGATLDDQRITSAGASLAAAAVAKGAGGVVGAAIGGASFGGVGAVLGVTALGDAFSGLGPAVKSATRITSAPNQRTLFQQVGIRTFVFTFKMIANNRDEAQEVKNIVKFFRQELYPEKILIGESGIPLAYKFPNMFEIDIKNRYDDNPAFKIQRCYLRDVQTSFNSIATGMHQDGNFVEVDISLSFQEIAALHKQQIRDGF